MTSMSHNPIYWTRNAEYVHQSPLMDIDVQGRARCVIERAAWRQEGRFRSASCQAEIKKIENEIMEMLREVTE